MATITRLYAALALWLFTTFVIILGLVTFIYGITRRDADLVGKVIAGIAATSGMLLLLSVITMALYKNIAEKQQYRRQVVFGSDERHDPDRIQSVRFLRLVRLFKPMFSWPWILITLIYLISCAGLYFLLSPSLALTATLLGIPSYLMIPASCCLGPSIIRSLEIISGYSTEDAIPMTERNIVT